MNPNITHQTTTDRMAFGGNQRPSRADVYRSTTTEQPGSKPRFIAKGHDAQLQEAQNNRLPTKVLTQGGIVYAGTVTRRDKYTITILTTDTAEEWIVYKHAIEAVLITKTARAA